MSRLTRSEAVRISREYLASEAVKPQWYQNIAPHINGVVLYGSTAREENREDSDIDILIFVPLEIEEAYTDGEYSYMYGGHEINIVLRSIERLRALAAGPCNQFETDVFVGAEILQDPSGEISQLINHMRAACQRKAAKLKTK